MTRASLLHVLDHLSEVSDTEVRELEQLATAFPYCQTAHLILAKAAHDRGSMLASQRLRRAATYATDRQLLRQLIEFTAPTSVAISAEAEPQPALQSAAVEDSTSLALAATSSAEVISVNEPATDAAPEAAPDEIVQPAVEATASDYEQDKAPTDDITHETLASSSLPSEAILLSAVDSAEPRVASDTSEEVDSFAVQLPGLSLHEQTSDNQEYEPNNNFLQEVAAEQAELEPVAPLEELLPPAAPPIRLPLETGFSQFEFGLADATPELTPVYELLDSDTEKGDAITTASPAFYGVPDVGYGLGAGSRLGYCLQSPDELTFSVPASSFEPDALILAHLAAHQPSESVRTSVDIISQFLRNKPRLKTPATILPTADEQDDLSVKSTRAEPDLASESLALIMVRQGKKDRAIEIYERLMVRQPEKMAYFADKIQKLKLSE
ncbi:hypothetical protein [Hymenobacter cavernae]|uniref:Tetratricopeptide repeat protein n=1 Tax=Hymenobacter cavernae TaxID=2044852 RepID=A0ABQ1TYV5_9BACT|nr:hypothetical protein [Hymenobacter cavernae]GGF06991.1 hypothetical protein GCM10011383_17560 [Hymenobacter cavernae]